jgi:hypothetical protein
MRGINAALDVVAPVKEMTVKKGDDLYLTAKTIAVMKERDAAKRSRNKQKYKFIMPRANPASSGRLPPLLWARTGQPCLPLSTTLERTS